MAFRLIEAMLSNLGWRGRELLSCSLVTQGGLTHLQMEYLRVSKKNMVLFQHFTLSTASANKILYM